MMGQRVRRSGGAVPWRACKRGVDGEALDIGLDEGDIGAADCLALLKRLRSLRRSRGVGDALPGEKSFVELDAAFGGTRRFLAVMTDSKA